MRRLIIFFYCLVCVLSISAQESEVKPDPLIMDNGEKVTSVTEWFDVRRPELKHFFESDMYGIAPEKWDQIVYQLEEKDTLALNGLATRYQFRVLWDGTDKGPFADVLVYLPNHIKGKVPVVIGLNFEGNHTVHTDPFIRIPDETRSKAAGKPILRGTDAAQWPVELILRRGYGVATAYRNQVSMDRRAEHMSGVRSVYPDLAEGDKNWATVSAWAWGLSRITDYLVKDERIDRNRICVLGFSRLGKAALWAGATDERFSCTVSLGSGAGGAKMLRRGVGEKVGNLVGVGYWFCRNFAQYAGKDTELPFDSYEMMSLIAPRALYVASGSEDGYADPLGEYLSTVEAAKVYRFLGYSTSLSGDFPKVNTPVGIGTRVGYHVRMGKHDVTPLDWQYILDFLDRL